ncbi:pilus assembly protein N-terminal domain-containing protein [Microvirga sp. ACRRW]|uniref:pilus assembly protein N-terminal domain-containing protein n=1 Tax=Microvirga sp. ACRRW TaxID=2918205 RepID=UPI001EF5A48A|nr:pilus assembly protein N-terminal domain-containing protein [Microvirga sp. ACRRW]MCG7391508.1 pilus assembly protein N-terminal domain-containing protein [Microvirga sp. ACRRW]
MQCSFLKITAAVLMLGALGLSGESRADEATLLGTLPSTDARLRIGLKQSTLPVALDFAKILTFEHPARTIVIGNPAIADGTLSDEYNMVLTGKAVGVTNMIVLGEAGREIAHLKISVSANSNQVTTVYQGASQQVYSCIDTCRPVGKTEPVK